MADGVYICERLIQESINKVAINSLREYLINNL